MPVKLVGMLRRRGPPVCDHDDLLCRPALTVEQQPRSLQAGLGVCVLAASRDTWQVCDSKFLGAISKAYNIQDVMGKRDPNQMGSSSCISASRTPWAGGIAVSSLPSQAEYKNRLLLSPGRLCAICIRDSSIIA